MCGLRERRRGTVLTRLLSGYETRGQQNKEYVCVIALVNKRVCSLHSGVNSFLHAVVFIHKKIVTFRSMQIILKRSKLRAQPRLLQ